MKYENIIIGKFIDRPNRFISHVEIDGKAEIVHVKNTGRCKELLLPGVKVGVQKCDNPDRKTQYDLISVYKEGTGWINIDSQIPNKVVFEWLKSQDFYDLIKPEYKYGNSRVDFYMEKGKEKYLMEVKGCTLEIDGEGYFPDAPTERGVKHLYELAKAADCGINASLTFVIAINNIKTVYPNISTHPEFGVALEYAIKHNVRINYLQCKVSANSIEFA